MRKIFWDTMLLIYILEDKEEWQTRLISVLSESRKRGDQLFTSFLALGEIMAGAKATHEPLIRDTLAQIGFEFLVFNSAAVHPFSRLRSLHRVAVADSIHLACAASEGIDLFLTQDARLKKLHVPGIKFIAGVESLA